MPYTYPRVFPADTVGLAKIRLTPRHATAYSESPFTLDGQVVAHAGMRWAVSVQIPPVLRDSAETWASWLASMKGRTGTFLAGDPNSVTPRGSAATAPGTPLVKGANQTGSTLTIDGVPANAPLYLARGDYVQLGTGGTSRLFKVLLNAPSDGTGTVVLDVWPDIVTAFPDNNPVVVSGAVGKFRLDRDDYGWEIDNLGKYTINFGGLEAR